MLKEECWCKNPRRTGQLKKKQSGRMLNLVGRVIDQGKKFGDAEVGEEVEEKLAK